MGEAKAPPPVKLVASLFSADTALLAAAQAALERAFGPVDYQSDLLPFDHTTYYNPEFGAGLKRRLVAFASLIEPDRLAQIKTDTNHLERKWMREGKRRVNIDPGYISLSKLVLATTKNHSHRLYLGQGIFAEVTLRYHKGTLRPWEWTYPDYASPPYIAIFNHIRKLYKAQLKETRL